MTFLKTATVDVDASLFVRLSSNFPSWPPVRPAIEGISGRVPILI
jgi:hypothetical protein